MKSRAILLGWIVLAAGGCGGTTGATPDTELLGGDTTIFDEGEEAFTFPLRNMSSEKRGLFQIGDGIFNRNWVAAPASVQGSDGLGPTFNAISCAACHDSIGRGATPATPTEAFAGLLLRLSVPGQDEHGGPRPHPDYGDQFQHRAILGVPAEGAASVSYKEMPGTYGDGTAYSLRTPSYKISAPGFGPLDEGVMLSPRLAPQMQGLGLLEAVSESTIRGFAAQNGGKVNEVWDTMRQKTVIGRFGWKANQPNLEQQTFAAFRNDIGITNALYPAKNCPPAQVACAAAPPSETQPNIAGIKADSMVVHALGLAVPARRRIDDPKALRGEALFQDIGCARCHIAKMTTGTLDGWPELSNQTIRPFTDLCLHDMGPGLADGRPDYLAGGSEWRTPPLWTLGLVEGIEGFLFLLHDGRARGFAEAILWHDGEARGQAEAFRALSKADRDALLAFLQSL